MAINPNTAWNNQHNLYLAASGGGKSQAIKQNKAIPGRGVRVVAWDVDEDHNVRHFYNRADFARALLAGCRSGRGFRIGYAGECDVKSFEWWCALVFAALDGNVATHVIIEELADVSQSIGKASPAFGQLLRRGRKYGAIVHAASQRGTEISKTVFTQSARHWVGIQEGTDVDRMARLCAVEPAKIRSLKPLEFLYKEAGKPPVLKKLNKPS